jgi:hypothetical protein
MILTFQWVIKRPHRAYTHKGIDDVLNSLTQPELPRGAIPQISEILESPIKRCTMGTNNELKRPAKTGSS